jgi:DNA-binding CsgD family transcriptional regulator
MFRDLIAMRYAAYAVIAVCAVILFLILEPYLMYAFRGKSAFLEALEGRGFEEETGNKEQEGNSEREGAEGKARALAEKAFENLTGQELRVAELLLRGYTANGTAKVLNITYNTVLYHRKNLYSKLGIHSMQALFALAERRVRKRSLSGC